MYPLGGAPGWRGRRRPWVSSGHRLGLSETSLTKWRVALPGTPETPGWSTKNHRSAHTENETLALRSAVTLLHVVREGGGDSRLAPTAAIRSAQTPTHPRALPARRTFDRPSMFRPGTALAPDAAKRRIRLDFTKLRRLPGGGANADGVRVGCSDPPGAVRRTVWRPEPGGSTGSRSSSLGHHSFAA